MVTYVCNKCDKAFSNKTQYTRHLNKKNPCDKSKDTMCPVCETDFSTLFNVEKHMKHKHPDHHRTLVIRNVNVNVNTLNIFAATGAGTVAEQGKAVSGQEESEQSEEPEEHEKAEKAEEAEDSDAEEPHEDSEVDAANDSMASIFSGLTTLQPVVNVPAYLALKANFIYLIREREHISLQQPVYKIGRTEQLLSRRMAGYPKDSELIVSCQSADSHKDESLLKELLHKNFKCRRDIGYEYFEGNVSRMKFLSPHIFRQLVFVM